MRFSGFCGWILAAMLAGLGCKQSGNADLAPSSSTTTAAEENHPQPKLPTVKLWLGSHELVTEVARSPKQMQTGMMFRTEMAENEAMLFVFNQPHRAAFWMKNTIVPLSAAYIDPQGVILEIHDLQPGNTNAVEAATGNVQYVLETRQGWFQRNRVGAGAVVLTEKGALGETFFGRRP